MPIVRPHPGEFSSIVREIEHRWSGPLRNAVEPGDTVLRGLGNDYAAYEELRRDDRIAASYEQRFSLLLDRPWEVVPGGDDARDKAAAAGLGEMLRALDWDAIAEEMLWAVHFGHSVAECIWEMDGRAVYPARILVRKRGRFRWRLVEDPEPREPRFELLLVTPEKPLGEPMPARKFWEWRIGSDHADDPYGLGLGRVLYWLVTFKREWWKFWLVAGEKFGMPTSQARHRSGADKKEIADALEVAQSVHSQAAIAVPEDVELSLIESARRAGGDYEAFSDRLDTAIARTILTETMTSEDGSSLSQAQVHLDVLQRLVRRDGRRLAESFARGPGRWLTEWNWPGAAVPRIRWIPDDSGELKERAERDKTIADMGFRPARKYIESTYGVPVEERAPVPAPGAVPPPAAARPATLAAGGGGDLDAVEQVLAAIDDDQWREIATPVIGPVLRLAQDDPETFLADVSRLYPAMGVNQLAERLARALFVAQVWGRLEAEEEGD